MNSAWAIGGEERASRDEGKNQQNGLVGFEPVDSKNRDNIELVPVKAKAGYTAGYNDPEFISSLPTFQLPFLRHL